MAGLVSAGDNDSRTPDDNDGDSQRADALSAPEGLEPRGPLRVGLVGFGDIAQQHWRALTSAGAEVVGAVTTRRVPDPLVAYASFERMLSDIDAVTIAVPNVLHAHLCAEAVEARKAVFVEKPLCVHADELTVLEPLLRRARAPVQLGFRLRWHSRLIDLRARVRDARRVVSVACGYRLDLDELARGKPWTRRRSLSGGTWGTLGIHALDLARWLVDAGDTPLDGLEATSSHLDDGADFPLVAAASGRLATGTSLAASVDLRTGQRFVLDCWVDVETEPGDIARLTPWTGRRGDASGALEAPGDVEREYDAMLSHFVRAADAGLVDRGDLEASLAVHRTLVDILATDG